MDNSEKMEESGEPMNADGLLSSDSDGGAVVPPDGTETVVLDSVCEESRNVLNHRIDLLQETDNKVARTVRTAVLVLSIILSAVGIGGIESVAAVSKTAFAFAGVGMIGLFLTVIYGIMVYSDSETTFGPDETFRMEPRSKTYSEREWTVLLTIGYDEWVADMKRVNDRNTNHLWRVQILLVLSLFALLSAIALSMWPL